MIKPISVAIMSITFFVLSTIVLISSVSWGQSMLTPSGPPLPWVVPGPINPKDDVFPARNPALEYQHQDLATNQYRANRAISPDYFHDGDPLGRARISMDNPVPAGATSTIINSDDTGNSWNDDAPWRTMTNKKMHQGEKPYSTDIPTSWGARATIINSDDTGNSWSSLNKKMHQGVNPYSYDRKLNNVSNLHSGSSSTSYRPCGDAGVYCGGVDGTPASKPPRVNPNGRN